MNTLDIICIAILIIIILLICAIQLIWYIEKKISNISVKLPTIRIEKPCVLLQVSENLQGKIEISARNPRDARDYYTVSYY
jgi:hypothetical protein